ncbi:MAG: arsenic metallochaperone ArsD family protein [Candidatus Helarchaeota archaeon]
MVKLFIYELDLTGGTCGFPASIPGQAPADTIRNELIRRNRITKEIKKKLNIKVERILLKSVNYLNNEIVKDLLKKEGIRALPVFMLEEKIIYSGNFPQAEIIIQKIKENL